jgi:hypothetical protein
MSADHSGDATASTRHWHTVGAEGARDRVITIVEAVLLGIVAFVAA